MLEEMRAAPQTLKSLCQLTGIADRVVTRWLVAMREASVVRVVGYTEDARGRLFTRVWGPGPGEDAPRPGPRWSPAERMARVRARRRQADGVGVEDLV